MSQLLKYDLRGVSATKDEVHSAIKNLDKGLYPTAFCKILPDIAGGDADYCNLMHADTAGTKTSLAYLYWKETGDVSVWEGIAQDAIMMNLDDMACVGCVDNILLSSTIGRNKNLITGEVISIIINSAVEIINNLTSFGINVHLSGGETADVGDVVRTIDVGYTAFGRMKRSDVVVNDVQPGDVIVGLASYGQATYESEYNSGIGSNGLTSARHDLLSKYYASAYPDSFDGNTPDEVIYIGSKRMTDEIQVNNRNYPLGKLILSPTRTYLPVVKQVIDELKDEINGMIHCTGGGQTKVLKFVKDCHIIKDNLLPIPPIFELIQSEAKTEGREMYQVFNMGHRLEFYTSSSAAERIIEIAQSFNIDAQIIGRVEKHDGNKLTISSPLGEFTY